MKKILLPYEQTGYFSKVVLDYLRDAKELQAFYNLPPEISSVPQIIDRKKIDIHHREIVSKAILDQHLKFFAEKNEEKVHSNILSLKDKNTFTITTAHQPNLFLGPLYTIYKTISTILIADKLNETYAGYYFIPVFWIGSEDHDKEELNHIHLFGGTFKWNTAQSGAFGRMSTSSLRPWVSEIKEKLGNSPAAIELAAALDDCYVNMKNISAATRKFLYHFFAQDGLVVVDGDHPELKKLFIPILEKEFGEQFSYHGVSKSNEQFSTHYEPQISPREINLFYIDEGLRERIVKENDLYKVLNTSISFSSDEIERLIHESPEKFSPNVILRPAYQECVLPDVAIVGGGAEVTYWLQLKSLFDELQIAQPLVFLRDSVLWIDQVSASRLEKLQLNAEDLFMNTDELINHYIERQSGNSLSLDSEINKITEAFNESLAKAMQVDPSLKGAFESERVRLVKTLEGFEDRLRKAAKRKDETSVQQIRVLREKLFPLNSLQERHDNFMTIYSRLGREFIEALKTYLDPFEKKFTVLMEE